MVTKADYGQREVKAARSVLVELIIVMKGMAFADRMKEKDAWDIYFCITRHPGGIDGVVEEFQIYMDNGLVREGLTKISEKFASPAHVGPKHVADFEAITDSEERGAIQRDAYERVNNLLEKLGIRSLIF